MNDFSAVLFDGILPTVELSELKSVFSNPAAVPSA